MKGRFTNYGEGLYTNRLNRLQEEQAEWRRKHEALTNRKHREGQKRPRPFDVRPATSLDASRRSSTHGCIGGESSDGGSSSSPRKSVFAAHFPRPSTSHPVQASPPAAQGKAATTPRSAFSGLPEIRDTSGSNAKSRGTGEGRARTLPTVVSGSIPLSSSATGPEHLLSLPSETPRQKSGDAIDDDSRTGSKDDRNAQPNSIELPLTSVSSPSRSHPNHSHHTGDDAWVATIGMLAKKHHCSVTEVRRIWEEYHDFDTKSKGFLSYEEFEQAIRTKCNIPTSEDLPEHLLEAQCKLIGIGEHSNIKFEAYLSWAIATAYSEEVMVPDPLQRRLRHLAREYDLTLPDMEDLKAIFDHYDSDSSGAIDKQEFRAVVVELARREDPHAPEPTNQALLRYFMEVDTDGSGTVEFEEFLPWYLKVGAVGN